MIFQKFGQRVLEVLASPFKVTLICSAFAGFSVFLNGSAYQLWTLHQQTDAIQNHIVDLKMEQERIERKIKQASHKDFIERQAREQLYLVADDDLVFVFSEN